jgi:hypothetical protein
MPGREVREIIAAVYTAAAGLLSRVLVSNFSLL